jgi:hypothetical protein
MAEEEHSLALALATTNSSPGTTTVEVAREGASNRKERARRQTMSALFDELGALLPYLSPRVLFVLRSFAFLAIIFQVLAF